MTWNSAQPLGESDALGTPQFQGANSFYFVQNGLIVQGGLATFGSSGTHNIPLPAPLEKQILTIQLTRRDVSGHVHVENTGTTLSNLRIHLTGGGGSVYWLVIGV
jgi:hypothetical protein